MLISCGSRFSENREHTRWSVEDFLKSLSVQEISAERVRKSLNSGVKQLQKVYPKMQLKKLKKIHFLIVDDVHNMRRSLRAMLKNAQYGDKFYEAETGQEAWGILQNNRIHVGFIISDYNIPDMSGMKLLQLVRGNKNTRDIPFLMLTAEAYMGVVAKAAEYDVSAYLTKPFTAVSLEQKILDLVKQANNPSSMTIHLLNCRELAEKGDFDGGIAEAYKAEQANPQSSLPVRELGRLWLAKGELKNAQTCFLRAVSLNNLDVISYHALGQIFLQLNMTSKAIDSFSKAMEINPYHTERALSFAKLLLKKNQNSKAIKVLQLLLLNNAKDINFKEQLSEICSKFDLHELTITICQSILKDNPSRLYLNKKIGFALYRTGYSSAAIKMLEKTAKTLSRDVELLLLLAQIYMDMGVRIRADNWANKVVRIDPDNKEARKILLHPI